MNTKPVDMKTTQSFVIAVAAAVMLLFVFMTPGFGQKESPEQKNPLNAERATKRDGLIVTGYMTSADVSDDLDGSEDEYFYKFTAKPGKLTVTLEVNANETNAGAYLDLFTTNNKAILSNMLVQGADGGSERVSKSVNLTKAQDIIIRIKGIKYGSSGGYTGTYKILLEGTAVDFKGLASPEGAVEANKPDEAPTDKTGQNKAPDVAQPDATGQDKKATATPSDETDPKNKKPDAVDRAIEKGKTKSKKLLQVLDKVKEKIPD